MMNPGRFLESIRSSRPRVHCITNYVAANACANLLLAVDASPIMADDPMESAEITSCCAALVVSMGTPSTRRLEAIRLSAEAARRKGIPVILDPVGVTLSPLRMQAAQALLVCDAVRVLRGNASEIRVLSGEETRDCGLEAMDRPEQSEAAAVRLAQKYDLIVAMTGETDVITDGTRICRVLNGHPIQRSITGAGCQLTALLGAFAADGLDHLFDAVVSGVCMMGLCAEIAHKRMGQADGSAACQGNIIDAAYRMTGKQLEEGAKYEI